MRIPRSNMHCHTTFGDGNGSMEDIVLSAIEKGFVSLGFSEHAWTPYDDCGMKREDVPAYFSEFARLKECYAGKLELYLGVETDCYYDTPKDGFAYTIGAAHYLRDPVTGAYYTFDYRPEDFEICRDRIAGGDVRELVRLYYDTYLSFCERYRPTVVGHLDLITKLNRDSDVYFDQQSAWYRRLIEEAAVRVSALGAMVEVNTGGIFRGYKTQPYPSRELLGLLCELEVPVILSSDAHCADALDFWFDEAEQLLRDIGFRSVRQLRGGVFAETPLY